MKTDPSFIMAAAGTVLSAVWIMIFAKGYRKYDEITSVKAAKELKLNGIFHTGFEIMKLLKINSLKSAETLSRYTANAMQDFTPTFSREHR